MLAANLRLFHPRSTSLFSTSARGGKSAMNRRKWLGTGSKGEGGRPKLVITEERKSFESGASILRALQAFCSDTGLGENELCAFDRADESLEVNVLTRILRTLVPPVITRGGREGRGGGAR